MKRLDKMIYISNEAKIGAMVDVGEITCVYYMENEYSPEESPTVLFYVTDGWKIDILGRYEPKQLKSVAKEFLNRNLGEIR